MSGINIAIADYDDDDDTYKVTSTHQQEQVSLKYTVSDSPETLMLKRDFLSPKPFPHKLTQEGLFTRRCSDNLLADARILEQLKKAEKEREYCTKGTKDYNDELNVSQRHKIIKLIESYNKHSNAIGEPFKVMMQQDLDYEGALRFYFEDGKSELTKAVRLTNRTSTEELIPILVEKFSLPEDQYALYEVHEEDEVYNTILLYPDECPLARAISKKKVPRFVLRRKDENSNSVELEESVTKKRKKLFSFSSKNRESYSFDGDKSDKEKEKKKSSKKKNKIDKSIITVEINHDLEEEHRAVAEEISDSELEENKPVVETSYLSSEGEEQHQDSEETQTLDNKDTTEVVKLNGIETPTLENTISLDSDLDNIEVVSPATEKTIVTEEITAESVEVSESVPTLIADTEEESESLDKVEELPGTETLNRKLSFSNSSLFFEQDNDPPKLEKRKNRKKKDKSEKKKKPKNEKGGEKRSKSFSMMVRGHKKKDKEDPSANTELSTYKLAPGILKVFGDHVSEGSNYKAVRASTISSSQEVVRMALERYGFENCNPKDYVLCDVVGQFSPAEIQTKKSKGSKKSDKNENEDDEEDKPKWITEYVRAINDNEKPLVLQSLWKPTNGRSRRFELRKRHEVESGCFFINTADNMGRSSSQTSLFNDSEHSSILSGNESGSHANEISEYAQIQMSPHTKSNKIIATERQDTENVNKAPQFSPYLLLVNGIHPSKDKLIHKLEDPTVIVGPYVESELKQCNVILYSSDILLPHCWIYKKVKIEEDSTETNLDEINFLVFIEPANGADITVNGVAATTTTLLKPGHLVSFGKHYVFIFKDPTQNDISSSKLSWWGSLTNNQTAVMAKQTSVVEKPEEASYAVPMRSVAVQAELIKDDTASDHSDDSEDDENDDHKTVSGQHSNLATRKQVVKSNLQLTYSIKDEEELLHSIIDIADQELGDFKLTPAYFLMMAIEHSAATFTEIQTRKLLLKMCNGLQGIAWEKTKEIGKQSSVKTEDPGTLLDRVLPELRPVFFWMASALEMLHFLQSRLSKYLLPKAQVTTSKEALLTADEELLTVLEEVIMFTFQQTVYHLTKVLYIALPAIIDSNPFQDSDESEREGDVKAIHPSVANIPIIFQRILNCANEYQVHPQITSQLFAYLFFFSNASLFNALMERGPGGKFYRWTKGVQMRGNLDVLQDWAQANGLSSEFEEYLAKFSSAVDLLSTPKVQLLQYEWNQMRADNPALSAAQLQQLLSEYQLTGKQRPRGWYPPPEEVEPALRSSEVLESFATHPPLMLPSTSFMLNLEKAPSSQEFMNYLEILQNKFGLDDKNGSYIEPLKDAPTKITVKSKKVRTQSNIDMNDLQSAVQMKNEKNNNESATENKSTIRITSGNSTTTSETTQAQVGSVKSIQVQSKKSTVMKISAVSVSNGSANGYGGDKHPQQNEVDNLISNAPSLISPKDSRNSIVVGEEVYDIPSSFNGDKDDVFVASLNRGDTGLGLGLIDGMFTSLSTNGIYIRTIVPNTPASQDTRLRVGDRILAVNGDTLVGADYNKAMDVIMKAGNRLSFLVAKSDDEIMHQVLATST